MGQAVLIVGESGTGKSASLRNFQRGEVTYFNVAGKPLPFKGRFAYEHIGDSYRKIKQGLKELQTPVAVIDDCQYLMANEYMRRSDERGYDKFTEIAKNFWELITMVAELPYDKVVYFLSHIETDATGKEKVKTIGKMLDEKITVEGLFTIVLKTKVQDGKYSFSTQNNGNDTVKSPIGMFTANEIDNDLKAVDDAVRAYYELETPILTPDERPQEAPVMPEKPQPEPDSAEPEKPTPEPERRTRRVRKER
jgi:hypothetical protein